MAITIKKPKKSKINYKIDSTLIDNLYRTRIKLKKSARFGSDVAGVCLLGEKNGLIDEFVPIIARGGCWDSPSISHAVFDKAFLKMVEKDRAVMGMALIRPGHYDANLPGDFRNNIRQWKNAFLNINSTVWIVVSEKEITPYGVKMDDAGKLSFSICSDRIFKNPGQSKMLKIADIRRKMKDLHPKDTLEMREHLDRLAKTIVNDTSGDQISKSIEEEKRVILKRRKERLEKLKEQREAQKKKEERANELFNDQEKKRKTRQKQEKDGMKDTTDIGGGYFLIKGKNGKEVLWKK